MTTTSPIGVFDSGVGGLTVQRALERLLPCEDFIYLGDTARLPYGTKSSETVTQYALQAAGLLQDYNIKALVVACNTATALALPTLQKILPSLPCLGVIDSGAAEAVEQTVTRQIAVLATESTVRSGAYAHAIHRLAPKADVTTLACNLLVALAEEGWCEGREASSIVDRYLGELGDRYDTLVLGCTHFPLLASLITSKVGEKVTVIDGAEAAARAVQKYLRSHQLETERRSLGHSQFLVTDSPERFNRLAARFLGRDIQAVLVASTFSSIEQEVTSILRHVAEA